MRIGEAARATGLTVKAIRHYEAEGLLPEVARIGTYRDYVAPEIERLELIAHCRGLGFGIPEIRTIVGLVADAAPRCPPAEAMSHVVATTLRRTEAEIATLQRRAERLRRVTRYLGARQAAGASAGRTA